MSYTVIDASLTTILLSANQVSRFVFLVIRHARKRCVVVGNIILMIRTNALVRYARWSRFCDGRLRTFDTSRELMRDTNPKMTLVKVYK